MSADFLLQTYCSGEGGVVNGEGKVRDGCRETDYEVNC